MKIFILILSLLAPVRAVSCGAFSAFLVSYRLWNDSLYDISLNFDKARHGVNPAGDRVYVPSPGYHVYDPSRKEDIKRYACSSGLFTGYETSAFLTYRSDRSTFELAYLYIGYPYSGRSTFSYEAYNKHNPECRCQLLADSERYDCASFTKELTGHLDIEIKCR